MNAMMQQHRIRVLTSALTLAFIAFVGWRIYYFVIIPGSPFLWDEAAHAIRGLVIAEDLQSGDWLGFLYDTYRQVYWPPLHSWLAASEFLSWAPTPVVIRTVSLVMFL